MKTFKRIITSRKTQTAIAGLIAAVITIWTETDYTEEILTFLTVITGALVGGQAAIDTVHGSPSDGTLKE